MASKAVKHEKQCADSDTCTQRHLKGSTHLPFNVDLSGGPKLAREQQEHTGKAYTVTNPDNRLTLQDQRNHMCHCTRT
jgi:hypothetical protein